uniref:Elicitin n=1 Tax=Thraustotheca clavata TaxID=74557 RepID=A0A0A7CMJ8_9STRA|nr:secreted protein [Thraustotheca clavata]
MYAINFVLLPLAWMVSGMNSNQCSYVGLAPTLLPFFTNITKCTTASNYTFTPPTTLPTETQMMVLCNDPSCTATLSSLETSSLPNCSLTIQGKAYVLPKLVEEIVDKCVATEAPSDAVSSNANQTLPTIPQKTSSGIKTLPRSSSAPTTQKVLGVIVISIALVMQ